MNLKDQFFTPLTNDQETAISSLDSFLCSETNCFLLKGYAGTGKTFLMEGLVKYMKETRRRYRIMAPTGRAAMVIGNKTQSEAYTIHKSIYNFKDLEDEEHTFKLRYKLNLNDDSVDTVYLIDESSMISDVYNEHEFFAFGSGLLLKDLFSFINFPYRTKAKIIFIGDHAQLPPIGMNFSPALDAAYLHQNYQVSTAENEMREVVRQKAGSGILAIATGLRNAMEMNLFNQLDFDYQEADVSNIEPTNFEEAYLIASNHSVNPNVVVISHSTKQASEYNQIIRGHFFSGITHPCPGDLLIITKNNYNYTVDLYNGQFVKVIQVASIPESPKKIRFNKKGGEKAEIELVFRDVMIEAKDISGTVNQLRCKIIDNLLCSHNPGLTPTEQQALYVDFKNRYPKLKPRTKGFKDTLTSDPYFNALQVKYGYAITCHKSQGGEWPIVFVDHRVYMKTLSSGYFRWAYTGITRAKAHLFSIGAKTYTPFSEMVCNPISKLSNPSPERHFTPSPQWDKTIEMAFDYDFQKAKYLEIQEKLLADNIAIFIIHNNWVERYKFSKKGEEVTIDFNYGKKGFTGRVSIISTNDKEFAESILEKISSPFSAKLTYEPKNVWQQELYDFVSEQVNEHGLTITNVKQLQNCDRYFLDGPNGISEIDFWYKDNGSYTYLAPKSTHPEEDEELRCLLVQFN